MTKNTEEKYNMFEVLESGVARVRMEPRGDHGMEGFALDDVFPYQLVMPITRSKSAKKHYRIYPIHGGGWYDTCGFTVFSQYFDKEGNK